MSKAIGVRDLEDIWFDLEGPKRSTTETPVLSQARRFVRSVRIDAQEALKPGRELVKACGQTTLRRFETLLHVERYFHSEGDYGYLIGPACQILESELDRLLASPAREIATDLAEALRRADPRTRQALVLEKWAAREIPTTIGTEWLILFSLRRGLEHRVGRIEEFLDDMYRPRFSRLLASKLLDSCLDAIRSDYRNPACHGLRTFSADDYAKFVRLMVGQERFDIWADRGPEPPGPGPDSGHFHHQITESRKVEPASNVDERPAAEQLLALENSQGSRLAPTVVIRLATERVTRDILSTTSEKSRGFRMGDQIRIDVSTKIDAHLTLINIGTSGTIAVILPNLWKQETRIETAKPRSFPDSVTPECDLTLSGPPGRERIVAIVTQSPLPIAVLPTPGRDDAFRILDPDDVQALNLYFAGLDPRTWAVSHGDFLVHSA